MTRRDLIIFAGLVLVALFIIDLGVEGILSIHREDREGKRCVASGGVWLELQGPNKCLYGVREHP